MTVVTRIACPLNDEKERKENTQRTILEKC